MYPVSEAFLQAVQENTRRYYWTGKITTKAGAEYSFGNQDIVKSASAKGTVVIPFPSAGSGTGESAGTETVEASGGTESETNDISVEVELPVVWTEDGKATAYVTFEFNDEEILIHHPVETWGSGERVSSFV